MRRLLAFGLVVALLLTGCARGQTPPPAPPAASPGVADGKPGPKGGLEAVIGRAPDGAMQRVAIKAGEPVEGTGVFFLNVATGQVEGWVTGSPYGLGVSDDNRWVWTGAQEVQFLADRQTGSVYQWQRQAAEFVAARGEVAIFRAGSRFWVTREGLKQFLPVDVAADGQMVRALLAPDGSAAVLVSGWKVHLIDTRTGKARLIGQVEPPGENVYARVDVKAGRRGEEAVATALYQQGARVTVRVQRYSWQGKLLEERTAPGEVTYSPDGMRAAWHDTILDLSHALVIGSASFEPQWRVNGEMTCSLPNQGPYWLADGSGVLLNTSQGPRLLKLDGTLEQPAAAGKGRSMPVPAPDRVDLFAVDGFAVVDGSGKELARAVVRSSGGPSRLEPWGDRSDEIRFVVGTGGKGVSCDPGIFPPVVEKAPFPAVAGLEVKVAANGCVNLRLGLTRESPVATCVPGGTRLTAARPPGSLNKGELSRLSNPMSSSMGGEWWWYARTEKGERGWVLLSAEYLTWAAPRSGDAALDPVGARVADELYNLRFWLRVATGEQACATCYPGESLVDTVSGLMRNWCPTVPAEVRALPGFDPAKHGAGVTALEGTCAGLDAAKSTLGFPGDEAVWKQRLGQLLAGLAK